METVIEVKQLTKTYKGHERGAGVREAIASLFKRKKVISNALKGISFTIGRGEMVGFVGPNGAGKSTTIKLLTGILYPSSGEAKVLGFTPWDDRKRYVKQIGAVFGQKSQLWWDLPPVDAFNLSKSMYDIPESVFQERLQTMTKLLDVEKVMRRPTRELSLGERMKCEFIMALLHNPAVLFLDEPTIGVDALAKEEIRHFLLQINKRYKTTLILTTHDMDDIEEICERMIIIDSGSILYDGDLQEVKNRYITTKTVDFEYLKLKNPTTFKAAMKKGKLLSQREHFVSALFPKKDAPSIITSLMRSADIVDLTVHEPSLEEVIKEIYKAKEVKK